MKFFKPILFLAFGFFFFTSNTYASSDNSQISEGQFENPTSWSKEIYKLNDSTFLLKFDVSIEDHWHVYSHYITDGGPVPTSIHLDSKENIIRHDSIIEGGELKQEYDPNFEMQLKWYDNNATFYQALKLTSEAGKVQGALEFMTCDDKQCLPPDYIEFKYELPNDAKAASQEIISAYEESKKKSKDSSISQGKNEKIKKGSTNEASSDLASKSLITIFLISFISGFAALLTPCVFPMIPMTVSFFTKQSKTKSQGIRNALFYAGSIVAIYVLLGTVVTAIFGYDALNAASTNVWMNLLFFALLLLFGISFLGAFEITLPSNWINKADQASEKGGIIGIFFMALVLALVSFSCTGPIVGTLLVESANYGGVAPLIGMFGFSSALALPFGLFAAFPGWMNSLPKSGGWLNTVKVFLGFLEIAFAFKFLSNADLVLQLHYLEREMFLAIWIGVFIALTFYMFGFYMLPHDSENQRLSVGRVMVGVFSLIFTIYLIPGLWGAPLKLISGFPPPMSYSESPMGVGAGGTGNASFDHGPEGTHLGPQNLHAFHDYSKGLEYAKKVNKPVFVDFTGHACVNCRKMEENVWGESGVIEKLRDEVVVVSLYVDDKRALPEDEQIEVELAGKTKKLRTIGNKWSYLQARRYKTNTQPFYVMLTPKGKPLNNGSADYEHHGNATDFEQWLSSGINEFKSDYK